jgi:pimeloyl-ACP methyl ester carboxylesterase
MNVGGGSAVNAVSGAAATAAAPRPAEQARSGRAPDGAPLAWHVTPPAAEPAAPPVLLVHGLASNASRFEEFTETTALAGRHRLIRADLRGHGRALHRGPANLVRWCDDLLAILAAEGGRPAIVVGHSLGAQVALQLARRHPAQVLGLVLIDPVFREALHGRSQRIARLAPLWRLAARLVRAANRVGLHRGALPPLDLRALDRAARVALASPEAEAAFIAQYSSTRADLRHVPTSVYLEDMAAMCEPAPRPRELPQPVLALLSTGATFADAAAMREALAGPRTTLEAVECHHWPLTEQPQAVRAVIEQWCARRWG